MRDLPHIDALLRWCHDILTDHGPSCVCGGCRLVGQAEEEAHDVRDALRTIAAMPKATKKEQLRLLKKALTDEGC